MPLFKSVTLLQPGAACWLPRSQLSSSTLQATATIGTTNIIYKDNYRGLRSRQITLQLRSYHSTHAEFNPPRISTTPTATMRVKTIIPKALLEEVKSSDKALADAPHEHVPKDVILPEKFLDGPAPNLTKERIDWSEGGLLQNRDRWAVVLDGVLSEEECTQLVAAAEATTEGKWERAMVNIGGGMQALYEDTRNCGRIIWDRRDLAAKIWARVEPAVPEILRLENWADVTGNGPAKRNEVWKATRLNERLRFLKYVGGEYFKAHCDGTYETPDRTERSYFTLHLYLNDSEGKNGQDALVGGATTFHAWNMQGRMDVVPKAGRVLLFQHRDLLHSGDDVISGTKYTMRTDIMFRKEENVTQEE